MNKAKQIHFEVNESRREDNQEQHRNQEQN